MPTGTLTDQIGTDPATAADGSPPRGDAAAYESIWERLPDALTRVMQANGISQHDAQAGICRGITDGAIQLRAKLRRHTTKRMTSRDTVLKGGDFRIPTDLRLEELDWEESRPLKPWLVPPETFKLPGYWDLEWIELFRANVTNALCGAPKESKPAAENAPVKAGAKSRSRPAFERAQRACKALYPNGAPTQADVPNKTLCGEIARWLRENGLPRVSDDSILRAVGRRK